MMDHTMTKNPDSIPYNIWPAEALRLAEREAADSLVQLLSTEYLPWRYSEELRLRELLCAGG
ncbi:hypothetical protein CQA89_12775 [Klebsiella pneumoniae]|nr:hypothetical protein CQA89_12775 [Klebsiella pneumoniae]